MRRGDAATAPGVRRCKTTRALASARHGACERGCYASGCGECGDRHRQGHVHDTRRCCRQPACNNLKGKPAQCRQAEVAACRCTFQNDAVLYDQNIPSP
eukprot:359448-Chlamydomonas_euryale.AAC.3